MRRAVQIRGAGLWLAGTDDFGADVADGKTIESEAGPRHSDAHYRLHQQGKPDVDQSIASNHRVDPRACKYRGKEWTARPDVVQFAQTLEKSLRRTWWNPAG